MDIFLVIGIIVGLFAISTGVLLKWSNIAMLINGEAVIVILVGTAAVMNSFPKHEFINIPKLFGAVFSQLESILAIQEGKNPKTIERKLLGMLSPKDRKKFESTINND